METDLRITVTTESGQLQDLIKQLQSGTMTQNEYNKAIRELRNVSIVGSQAQRDLKEVISQVSTQTQSYQGQLMQSYFATGQALRTQEAGERGLTDTIRSARQERRLYMFAVREGMTAITAVTGAEGELTKAVTGGASAVFGMQFALSAMGGVMAEVALPLAIAVGLWVVLKGLWGDSEKTLAKLREEQLKDIDILIKLGEATNKQKETLLKAQLVREQAQLAEMQSISLWNVFLARLTGGQLAGVTNAADVEAQKAKVDALRLSIKELGDTAVKTGDNLAKTYEETGKAIYQLQIDTGAVSLADQRLKLQQNMLGYEKEERDLLANGINPKSQIILDLEKLKLETKKQIQSVDVQIEKDFSAYAKELHAAYIQERNDSIALAEVTRKNLEASGRLGLSPGTALQQAGKALAGRKTPTEVAETIGEDTYAKKYANNLSMIDRLTGSLAIAQMRWNDQFKTTNILVESFDQMIGQIQDKWTNALSGLIQGTLNIGQAFKTMGQAVLEEIETIIARLIAMKAIELILGLITGGASMVPTTVAGATAGMGGAATASIGGYSQLNYLTQASASSGNVSVSTKQMRTEIEGDKIVVVHQLAVQARQGRVG